MAVNAAAKAVVVMGLDASAVADEVRRLRQSGVRTAGFVGDDEAQARAMGTEMLGEVDQVVRI